MHGVGYMRDGKDVAEVIRLADTFPDRLREYVDRLVTAWHPSPPVPGRPIVPPVQHPCAKWFKDVSDCESDYESLLNCVQRHTRCSAGYCLRKKRGHDVAECRFGYSKRPVRHHRCHCETIRERQGGGDHRTQAQ